MTKINDPKNLNGKLFGYEIKYNQVEGLQIPNSDYPDLQVKPKYNGNIAEVDWKTNTITGDYLRRYGYVYDGLSRISAGFYQKDNNASAKEYFEKIEYDLNGNITNLKRSAEAQQGAPAFLIDNLTYVSDDNRLTSVTDSSTDYRGYPDVSGIPITYYDESGNMKSQKDKGILDIKYNYLSLPNSLTFDKTYVPRFPVAGADFNVNTQYLYRADGTKLKKIFTYGLGATNRETATVTEYLDGFQYEATSSTGKFTLGLKFVPTAEGYYNFENNKYIYSYTDHLGNVRLSYFNNGTSAEVLEENNYYPFGLKHDGYNALAGNPSYQYKYNGKELQQESGMYAMDWRNYMPELGRFSGMDVLSESYSDFTPYHFAMNNPVIYSDPTGMYSTDHNGNYSTTNTGEISKLQSYFGNGGSVDGLGDFISKEEVFKEDIPEVAIPVFKGSGTHYSWGNTAQSHFNSFMKGWNAKNDFTWDRIVNAGRYNDGPIQYVGGADDPFGIFEVGGMILSSSDNKAMNLAALPLLMVTGHEGSALKILAAEKGLLTNTLPISTEGKLLGSITNGQVVMNGNVKASGMFDFVITQSGETLLGRKHTFLSKGADVFAAGELKMRNGNIVGINNLSGHYVPGPNVANTYLDIFKAVNINVSKAHLKVYNSQGQIVNHILPK
jgi:RHS repeat-associated protein